MQSNTQNPEASAAPLTPLPEGTSPIIRMGNEAVVYHIPTTMSNPKTTILLPQHSAWSSGLHFHATHTEHLRLVQGSIFVRHGSTTSILSRSDSVEPPTITIPRYARHNWGRAQHYLQRKEKATDQRSDLRAEMLEEAVIVEEWTDPADISKPLFFWNLNGVILTSTIADGRKNSIMKALVRRVLGDWWIPFQLFAIFWELDNYPVFFELFHPDGDRIGSYVIGKLERMVEYVFTYTVLFTAASAARLVGVSAISEDRTPESLWVARKIDQSKLKWT